MDGVWRMEAIRKIHLFLISAILCAKWRASLIGHSIPGDVISTQSERGAMALRDEVDVVERIATALQGFRPIIQSITLSL
jgi:hypothetical protein